MLWYECLWCCRRCIYWKEKWYFLRFYLLLMLFRSISFYSMLFHAVSSYFLLDFLRFHAILYDFLRFSTTEIVIYAILCTCIWYYLQVHCAEQKEMVWFLIFKKKSIFKMGMNDLTFDKCDANTCIFSMLSR